MRQFLRLLVLLSMVVTLLPLSAATAAVAQPEVVPDDELVIINRDDRIVVRDPYTPPGYLPLSWESPQTGFRQVYAGDFNGDGTAEIVGLRGGEAYVFDPYRQASEPDTAHLFTASAGQVWQIAATGRFFGGASDGLVLVQSLSGGSITARMTVYAFQGSSWTQVFTQDLGATFQNLATGDTDGDGADELVGTRSGTGYAQILIFDPSQNWRTVYEVNYNWPWVALAVGNVQNAGETKAEISTTRSGVPVNTASFLVFRYTGSSTELQDVFFEYMNPPFQKMALADVTGNGIKLVYLLRPGISSGTAIVALTSRNPGVIPSVIEFNELANQTRFGNLQAGDVDADNRDELIVMAENEYIIYTDPANNTAFQSYPGAYSTSLNFAVGNLDGGGILPQPQLVISPSAVSMSLASGQSATRTVQITNGGVGTLNWTATLVSGAPWLSFSPASGTAPSSLVLTLNAAGLQPGQYTGQVRVDGASGTLNSPQNIAVALTVTAPTQPQLVVSPSAVSMTLQSGQSATRTVQVTNTGVGTLNWAASLVSGAPWLSFSPASGTAPSPLVLALNAAGLQPGQYTGQVRVDGGSGTLNSPQDVTVTLTVIAPTQPQLVVSPSAVSMTLQSGQSATRTVQVTNTGAGTLNWTATLVSGAPWLSFSPASGTAPSSLILTLNAAGLQPGQYSGLVRVDGGSGTLGSPQDITVTITVTEPPLPQLSVTPTAITLSLEQGQTTTRDVQIANTGAGTLDWTAALVQGAPWLSFSPTSGQAPSTLVLSISAVGVDPGQYVGKVQITGGGGALNSPQDVTVNLTVTPAPFYATPTSVAWTYIPPTNPGTRTVTVTGVGISWHAGVVPMDQMQRIQAAIDAGLPMSINNGILVINDGGEDVPIVDYIDVNPSSSGANQTGVLLNLVLDRVPYGFSQVAVVFVADGVAMPPAVVVRATVLRTLPNATDLFFLPMIVNGQP